MRLSFHTLLILIPAFLFSCEKEEPTAVITEPSEPYILSLIDPVTPVDSTYFIQLISENSELYFALPDSNIRMNFTSPSGFGNMIGKGYNFHNKVSDESLEVVFYAHSGKPGFTFLTANYRYSIWWMSLSGANINFYTPANEPYSYFTYLGINHPDAYFQITWLSKTRICGQFKTIMQASGGGHSYWVEGKFSIPGIIF